MRPASCLYASFSLCCPRMPASSAPACCLLGAACVSIRNEHAMTALHGMRIGGCCCVDGLFERRVGKTLCFLCSFWRLAALLLWRASTLAGRPRCLTLPATLAFSASAILPASLFWWRTSPYTYVFCLQDVTTATAWCGRSPRRRRAVLSSRRALLGNDGGLGGAGKLLATRCSNLFSLAVLPESATLTAHFRSSACLSSKALLPLTTAAPFRAAAYATAAQQRSAQGKRAAARAHASPRPAGAAAAGVPAGRAGAALLRTIYLPSAAGGSDWQRVGSAGTAAVGLGGASSAFCSATLTAIYHAVSPSSALPYALPRYRAENRLHWLDNSAALATALAGERAGRAAGAAARLPPLPSKQQQQAGAV